MSIFNTGQVLEAIRLRRKPQQPDLDAIGRLLEISVPRRSFIGWTLATASVPLVGGEVRAASQFRLHRDGRAVSFVVDGRPMWIIDPASFDGASRLSLREDSDTVEVRLSSARFPGTALRADLFCRLRRRAGGWSARLQFPAIGLDADLPFEPWLLRRSVAVARSHEDTTLFPDTDLTLCLPTGTLFTLSSSWSLRAFRPDGLCLRSQIGSVEAQSATLDLVPPDEKPRLFDGRRRWNTRISLASARGTLSMKNMGGFTAAVDGSLNEIIAEATSTRAGVRIGVVLESANGRIGPTEAGDLADTPGSLHPDQLRVALIGGDGLSEVSVDASLKRSSEWMSCGVLQVEVRPSGGSAAFRARDAQRKSTAQAEGAVVTRLVMPFEAVDQATFIRHGVRWINGEIDVSDLVLDPDIDDLRWCGGVAHLLGRRVSLDRFVLEIDRGLDMLHLNFRFRHVDLVVHWNTWWLEGRKGREPLIEVDFGSQHLQEEAFPPPPRPQQPPPLPEPLCRYFARPSHLMFTLEAAAGRIPKLGLSLTDLLDWRQDTAFRQARTAADRGWLTLKTSTRAADPSAKEFTLDYQIKGLRPRPARRPKSLVEDLADPDDEYATALDIPYRLTVSPVRAPAWKSTPVQPPRGEAAELWHARIERELLRAVWSPDYRPDCLWSLPPAPPPPFFSLNPGYRHQLVALTSRYGEPALLGGAQVVPLPAPLPPDLCAILGQIDPDNVGVFVPKPVDGRVLLLSTYGATLRVLGLFGHPPASPDGNGALTITRWAHDTQLGRETKVLVEEQGFWFPLSIPVTRITETTRTFWRLGDCFVAVLEQVIYFPQKPFSRSFPTIAQPFGARGWPFTTTSVDEWRSPNICAQDLKDLANLKDQAFWPEYTAADGSRRFLEIEFEDKTTGIRMAAPLVFLLNNVVHDVCLLRKVIGEYRQFVNTLAATPGEPLPFQEPRRGIARVIHGSLRFAPSTRLGDTQYDAKTFLLDVDIPAVATVKSSGSTRYGCHKKSVCTSLDPTCYLEIEEDTLGDTLNALRMNASLERAQQPPYYPHIRRARVESGQLARLSGNDRKQTLIEFEGSYLRDGFDPKVNSGELFARLVDGGVRLGLGGQSGEDSSHSGGVVAPSIQANAITRPRGFVGGPALGPQTVYYRVPPPPNNTRSILNPALLAAAADQHALDWLRNNTFDPKQYFAETFGDAKLLGVVRLVDILAVVLNLTGTEMPTIVQELEYALGSDVARTVVPAALAAVDKVRSLIDRMAEPSTAGRLRQRLDDVSVSLRQLLAAATGTAGDTAVIPRATEVGRAIQGLAEETQAIADDPKSLLPPDAMRALDSAKAVLNAIDTLSKLPADDRDRIVSALVTVAQKEIQNVVTGLQNQPQYSELLGRVTTFQRRLQDLESEATASGERFLTALASRLAPLQSALEEALLWCDSANRTYRQICDPIARYLQIVVDNTSMWAAVLGDAAAAAGDAIRIAKRKLDTRPDLAALFAELSDASAAALAHATDLATLAKDVSGQVLLDLCSRTPSDQPTQDLIQRARGVFDKALTGVENAVRQALRITDLTTRTLTVAVRTSIPEVDAAEQKLAEYLYATIMGASSTSSPPSTNPPTLQALLTLRDNLVNVSTDTTVPAPVQAAARWLLGSQPQAEPHRLARLIQSLENIRNKPNDLATIAAEAGVANEWQTLRWVLAAITDLSGRAQSLVQALATSLRDRAYLELGATAVNISPLFDGLRSALNRFLSNDPQITQCLTPALREGIDDLETALTAFQPPDPTQTTDPDKVRVWLGAWITQLADILARIQNVLDGLRRALGSGNIEELVDVNALVDYLTQQFVPTTAKISYQWQTPISEYPKGAGAIFEPGGNRALSVNSVAVVDLLGRTPPTSSVQGTLDSFSINLLGATRFLTIQFAPLTFTAGSGRDPKLDLKVTGVVLGDQLQFVKMLEDWLTSKSGLVVRPATDGPGLIVGYEYYEAVVPLTAFTLQNVGFSVLATLPFDNRPARFEFKLAEPNKPFLLSVGIYGGGGHVGIAARAENIEYIDASFEYGLVTAFQFGPASGTGRITAGVYFRLGDRRALVTGFFNASGNADIAGLITVSATFRVEISYDSGSGQVRGAATFSINFKIGPIPYGFSIGVAYARQGDSQGTGQSQVQTRSTPTNARALSTNRTAKVLAAPASRSTSSISGSSGAPTDPPDLSSRLLESNVWRYYWQAFEESDYVCR